MKGSIKTKLDEEAYKRDGYRCVKCGTTKGLEAHHLVYEEKLENLITLCHACHKKEHKMSGCFVKGNDNRRDETHLERGHYKGHPFWGNQYTQKSNP